MDERRERAASYVAAPRAAFDSSPDRVRLGPSKFRRHLLLPLLPRYLWMRETAEARPAPYSRGGGSKWEHAAQAGDGDRSASITYMHSQTQTRIRTRTRARARALTHTHTGTHTHTALNLNLKVRLPPILQVVPLAVPLRATARGRAGEHVRVRGRGLRLIAAATNALESWRRLGQRKARARGRGGLGQGELALIAFDDLHSTFKSSTLT